ncbi:MAG TPA: DUF3857 domain-containing protein [Chitinophagaceae bacterium]|nr:DUF3857 domain-containing protein [Chitinophagaceae bacterium]
MKPYSFLLAALLVCTTTISAQEKSPVKFGKISPADFIINQPYDTGASAIVIADIGSSAFEGNMKGWFSLVYKRTTRIKILNKNGFEAASEQIGLYSEGGGEENLDDIKGYTYNLENGKVIETKLDAASIFKDKLNKNYVLRKFTLPAVKEGSIIEYSYTIKSDYIRNLRSWYFQSEYPCLYSSYEVGIPEFFNYVTIGQGYLQPEMKTSSYSTTFRITIPGGADKDERGTLDGTVYTRQWVVKNIPPLKTENYTSAIKNYIGGVEFQLSSHQFRGGVPYDYMGNWVLLGKKLMEDENFGASLSKNNNWLDDDLKNVTKGATTKLEKTQKIFAYVRDNMTCTDHSANYIETSLKDAYKKHNGNVADINLMLAAMLRHEGISADPLVLSTKENGFTSEVYPLWQRFNYVICEANIDGVFYNLDASSPYNGFAKLPPYCYNGHARVITKEAAMPVYFEPDSLKEQKMTSVFISNDEKDGLTGSFKSQLGYYESFNLRKKLKGDDKDYLKNIKSGNSFEINVTEAGIDSLKKPDMPASIHYEFSFKPAADENIIYFNPMMSEGYKENPFTSADRKYPVEMSYTIDEIYLLNMEIPKGYTAEEIPKSVKVAFNDDEGIFEYLVQKSDDGIQLRSRIKLNKATFTPEDYSGLRDFFAFIVKKQNEQIVFKKK